MLPEKGEGDAQAVGMSGLPLPGHADGGGSALEGGRSGGSAQMTAELAAGFSGLRGARDGVQWGAYGSVVDLSWLHRPASCLADRGPLCLSLCRA